MNNASRNHIINYLDKDMRIDSRKPLDYRDVDVKYAVSKTAEGSATVRIGETVVMAGVKMALTDPFSDRPDEGMLMVNTELVPLSSPDFELGPPSEEAIEIARVVDRGIRESKAIDLKELCLKKGEKVWSVNIDIVPLNDSGNIIDAAALASIAALKDTKFPGLDGDLVDYKKKTDKGLPLQKTPLSVTVLKIGSKFIIDPLNEEEAVVDARLTVASTEDGKLCALQKGGEEPLTADEISSMLDIGIETAKMLRSKLG